MFNTDPAAYLSHRYPFLMLDRIVELHPADSAVAQALVSSTRGFPQVLLMECIAQLAGIVAAKEEGEGGFLATIDHAEFSGIPSPGDHLTVEVRVIKAFGRLFMMEGSVNRGDECLLKAQLTIGTGKL